MDSCTRHSRKQPPGRQWINKIHQTHTLCQAHLSKAITIYNYFANKKQCPGKPLNCGDKVYLEAKNLKLKVLCTKLGLRKVGPFCIIEFINKVAYHIDLPDDWKCHTVFHQSLSYHKEGTSLPHQVVQ